MDPPQAICRKSFLAGLAKYHARMPGMYVSWHPAGSDTHTHSPDQPKFFVFALQNEYIHDNLELLAMAPYIICKHGVARHHTTCRAGKEPAKP